MISKEDVSDNFICERCDRKAMTHFSGNSNWYCRWCVNHCGCLRTTEDENVI